MTRAAILDLDGTVYRGDRLVDGADEAIATLRRRGLDLLFCSNNPTKTPAEYVATLGEMGIEADESEVLPASTVTRSYLNRNHASDRIYLLGVDSLADYLREGGLELVDTPRQVDTYVASWTDEFDFADMDAALDGITPETTVIATDPDRTIPTDGGQMPGSGAVAGAIARTIGREPDVVLGKPSREAGEMALERLGVAPAECVVVGDRLDTDLALGERFGMTTVLVESGVSDGVSVDDADVIPDHVVESLAAVPPLLR
jgi:HAD superfamily hydrolase (TIGR01450 family)